MDGKQRGFSAYKLTIAKKKTSREQFLHDEEAVVIWQALIDLIEREDPPAAGQLSVPGKAPDPFCCNASREVASLGVV